MKAVDFHPVVLKIIKGFPINVRKAIGQAILELQKGEKLSMPLSRSVKSIGSGVEEIRNKDLNGIYRTFYLVTPKKEIKTAKKRLKEMLDG